MEGILGLNSEEASSLPKDDDLDEVNEAIMLALFDELFSSVCSVRQMACRISVPKSTGYRQLVDSLHFTVRHQTSSFGSSQALRQSAVRRQVKAREVVLTCRFNVGFWRHETSNVSL
jgi:hypothetical protein